MGDVENGSEQRLTTRRTGGTLRFSSTKMSRHESTPPDPRAAPQVYIVTARLCLHESPRLLRAFSFWRHRLRPPCLCSNPRTQYLLLQFNDQRHLPNAKPVQGTNLSVSTNAANGLSEPEQFHPGFCAKGLCRRYGRSRGFSDPFAYEITMVSVISACAKAGALDLGRWVHMFIEKNKIIIDLELSTALLDMYSKCGSIERARGIFNEMVQRDTKAWSSMIVGLANHGLAEDALELFNRMEETQVKPNQVTFIGVLSACAHRGLVSEGQKFWSRLNEFGIEPSMEHYGCMTDLLCRAGLVEQAYDIVQTMTFSPNAVIWRTLLGGFMKKRITDKGERVAKQLLEVEPLNAENYVLISNFYASTLQWEKVSHMRKTMKENGVKTIPGCSSIEVDGFVHEFVMGDESHPESREIREVLMDISVRVQQAGHVPCTSGVLHDVREEEKTVALCEHSERLAIAYAQVLPIKKTILFSQATTFLVSVSAFLEWELLGVWFY
ncbi:hypothetical protein H6P81_003183 [Aristolochia fimbriata]|uniref:DYW domain-containing protein n=1 Tax=Aristolochia fimbriata TaxID=158543 RepID=A0AAV7FBU6_ARIFI|nr:hypothetical protein H6P81_003183 [Aristolochia fimbriata]